MMELTILSAAFAMGAAIPPKHTCLGDDVSPPLSWTGAPAETKSIAVLCDDPDAPAGDWVHWVLFNLPGDTGELAENVAKSARLPNGAVQGVNDFGRPGYGGPCPPPGKAHRYYFRVYALDAALPLGPGVRMKDVLRAMEGHILAKGELMGTFRR
jgi:hypothetical protein